jgi:hypothetical protein
MASRYGRSNLAYIILTICVKMVILANQQELLLDVNDGRIREARNGHQNGPPCAREDTFFPKIRSREHIG